MNENNLTRIDIGISQYHLLSPQKNDKTTVYKEIPNVDCIKNTNQYFGETCITIPKDPLPKENIRALFSRVKSLVFL